MRKILTLAVSAIFCSTLSARDDVLYFSLDFLNSPKAKEVLNPNVKLSFGSGGKGKILKQGLTANKKNERIQQKRSGGLRMGDVIGLKDLSRPRDTRGRQ